MPSTLSSLPQFYQVSPFFFFNPPMFFFPPSPRRHWTVATLRCTGRWLVEPSLGTVVRRETGLTCSLVFSRDFLRTVFKRKSKNFLVHTASDAVICRELGRRQLLHLPIKAQSCSPVSKWLIRSHVDSDTHTPRTKHTPTLPWSATHAHTQMSVNAKCFFVF